MEIKGKIRVRTAYGVNANNETFWLHSCSFKGQGLYGDKCSYRVKVGGRDKMLPKEVGFWEGEITGFLVAEEWLDFSPIYLEEYDNNRKTRLKLVIKSISPEGWKEVSHE